MRGTTTVPFHPEWEYGVVVMEGAVGIEGRVSIDRQHRQVYRAQIEVASAVRRAVAEAGLDRALVDLVTIRVSQINRCASCLHVHVRDAQLAGETSQRIAVLPAWRDTTLFTDAERAALTLAESLTTLPDARTQEADYADAARHLTDEQLSAVSWLVIAMNAFNRISIVSRHRVRPPRVTHVGIEPSGNGVPTTTRKATS
jgi:AhpD family alkylhydroperoxidase